MSICGYSGPLERLDAGAMAGWATSTTRLPASLVEPLFAADGWMQAPSPLIASALAAAAPNTRHAWAADWGVFRDWCLGPAARHIPERHARVTLPVAPELLAHFIRDQTTGASTADGRLRRLTTLRRYLSPPATALVRGWLERSGLQEGPLFTRMQRTGQARLQGQPHGQRLGVSAVNDILKDAVGRLAESRGELVIPPEAPESERSALRRVHAADWSGHSLRVGAAQDMAALGVETAAILQAGGWKDVRMIKRYLRQLSALEGGMAQWWAAQRTAPCETGA
jgi:hypothetical protein